MSETDKQRRLAYKRKRQRWIFIQIIAIALLAAAVLTMTLVFSNLNKTYYVSYTESGSADYIVNLKGNEFYEGGSLGGGQGYITELINDIEASFKYEMLIGAEGVKYDYSRYIDARIEITDKSTDKILYSPTYMLMSELSGTAVGSISLAEGASIDYHKYNTVAKNFINTYGLSNVDSRLIVTMYVKADGVSDEFIGKASNEYSTSLIIPLCEKTIALEVSASAPSGETSFLPCRRDINPSLFKVLAIAFAALMLLALGFLAFFIRFTRNEDIDYELKVKRILNSYRSYIQVITNEFDSDGYQVLTLGSFNEMLGIRDTIQSPILMYENEDKTRTVFFIPTNTKILYLFEIKVDDYDALYINASSQADIAEEPQTVIFEENTELSELKEVTEPIEVTELSEFTEVTEPIELTELSEFTEVTEPVQVIALSELEEVAEVTDGANEDDKEYLKKSRFKRSFIAKLTQSESELQDYYNELKNEFLSHKGVKARISWNYETYTRGRALLSRMVIRGKMLILYFALNPAEFKESKYHHSDSSNTPRYAEVPFTLKVRSERALKYAKELISVLMSNNGIEKAESHSELDYRMPYKSTEELFNEGLIKEKEKSKSKQTVS